MGSVPRAGSRRHLLLIAAVNLLALAATPLAGASGSPSLHDVVLGTLGAGYVVVKPAAHAGSMSPRGVAQLELGAAPVVADVGRDAVAAYARTFDHPAGGGVVTILAIRFHSPGEVSRFLHDLERADAIAATRADVPTVAGAIAYARASRVAGTVLHQFLVAYRRGDVGVVVDVTTHTGDLSLATAVQVAGHQSAAMSRLRTGQPSALVGMGIGAVITAVAVLSALVVVRRKDDAAPRGEPTAASPTSVTSSGAVRVRPSVPSRASGADAASQATGTRAATQTLEASPTIYCSWCGRQRPTEQLAVHHCGSRDRPPRFCSACGASLVHEQLACSVCGTSTDRRS